MSDRIRQGRSGATMRSVGIYTVMPMTAPIRSVVAALLAMALVSCSVDDEEPPAAHPDLECEEGEQSFTPPSEIDVSGPGAATADEALRQNLGRVIAALGQGEIVSLSEVEYAIVLNGRIVSISRAAQNADGDWHVIDMYYCESVNGNDDGVATPVTVVDVAASEAQIVATAVDAFKARFGANVLSADVLVMDNSDRAGVVGQLDSDLVVVGTLPDGAYWRVLDIRQVDGHYEVDIESVDGANYFAGTIIILEEDDGRIREIDPSSVGVTVETSVS